MRFALRAVCSVLMLALVLTAGVLGGVLVVAAVGTGLFVAFRAGGGWAVAAGVLVAALLGALGVAILVVRRRQSRGVRLGVSITTEEQPLLWVEIYRVAEGLGVRAPDELSLFLDTNVAVSEGRTWLGLRPGERRLRVGLPLLAGLTERELRAVIAHEFSRRWGPASPARVICRGQEVIGMVAPRVEVLPVIGRAFRRYREVYSAVSGPVVRRHELEVDSLCADFAGNNATAAAMREVAVLSTGWRAFVDGYAEPAAAVRRRPADLLAGFTCFMAEPGRRLQLAASPADPGSSARPVDDTELTLGDRLAAIESLPDDDIHDKSGPALGMMRNPDHVIRRVEASTFGESDEAASAWEDIVPEAARAAAGEDALQLARLGHEGGLGPSLSVANLLELISHGLLDEMVRPMLAEGASRQDEHEMARRLVTGFLATAAIESGTASYRFSWAAPRQLVDDQGVIDDLPLLVESALTDGSTLAALELWLTAHRVGLELEIGADLGQAVRESEQDARGDAPGEGRRRRARQSKPGRDADSKNRPRSEPKAGTNADRDRDQDPDVDSVPSLVPLSESASI